MTTAGSPGTASDGFRVPVQEGRHRAPPPPPTPPKFLGLHAPIAAAAVLLTAASVIAIYAPGAAWDVQAVEPGVTMPTASRATVALTAGPLEVPTIGAEGAWDPETVATPSAPRDAPQTWAGVSVVAEAPVRGSTRPTEVTQAIPTTTDRPPTTLPGVATTENTTAASPASTSEAATDSGAPTSTEETTVTAEPTQTAEPTDVVDVITETLEEAP